MNLACAAGVGAVSGLRSMSGPAVAAETANRHWFRSRKAPLGWLGSGITVKTLMTMAIGEMIADKLPFMPNRTEPASLTFRAVSGAFSAYAICGRRGSLRRACVVASVGAAAAVAASYAGLEYRRRVPLHPLLAAVLEDAVTVGAGKALVAAIGC